jgi:uncharacterized protein YecT (DUF1311 family)
MILNQETEMKHVTWITALIVTLAFSTSIGASNQTQSEMNAEACGKYKKADAELNRVYQKIMRDYAGDKNFIQKMKIAQRAWIAFRDAHLDSLYPESDSQYHYGSVNPMCRCMELESLTQYRINLLREWADGVQEGDVCSGSKKIRQ